VPDRRWQLRDLAVLLVAFGIVALLAFVGGEVAGMAR